LGSKKKAADFFSQPLLRVLKELLALFLRIALLAGFAGLGGFLTALVSAFLAGGFRLFAAGFRTRDAYRAEKGQGASNGDE
jgi:hypothetical protein